MRMPEDVAAVNHCQRHVSWSVRALKEEEGVAVAATGHRPSPQGLVPGAPAHLVALNRLVLKFFFL